MTKIVRLARLHETETNSTSENPVDRSLEGCVVTIGNFDGVHRGHAALLEMVTAKAKLLGAPTVVVVFDPHPAAILRPDRVPPRLTWIQRRAQLLDRLGIDVLLACETSTELLNLTAEDFFQKLIVQRLQAQAIFEGPNFFFGRGRGGNVETMAALCQQHSIDFSIATPANVDGEMISSTRIRESLIGQKIEQANAMLGISYQIRGRVTTGQQRGRTIGFPTANLCDIDVVVPGPGVYGGFARVENTSDDANEFMATDSDQTYQAAIHIGPNPTFDDDGSVKTEVHLLDYSGDLYDKTLLVDFVTFVRDIARFESVEQLTQQLSRDVKTVRTRLNSPDGQAATKRQGK